MLPYLKNALLLETNNSLSVKSIILSVKSIILSDFGYKL